MEPGLLGWIVYLGISGAGAFYFSQQRMKKDRRLRELAEEPRVPIAEATDRAVQKVAGELRLIGEPLLAPLSGRECAYYEVTIEEVEEDADGRKGWATRYFDWGAVDFEIEDETGRARVSQRVPNVLLDIDAQVRRRVFRDVPAELTVLLERQAAMGKPVLLRDPRKLRAYEGVLAPGELITVHGLCCYEASREGGDYRHIGRQLVLREPAAGEMLITDKRC